MSVHLIFYSKPGCHLCEGLHEKLEQIQSLDLDIDVRDITTRDDWFQAYQYEIPVLVLERGVGSRESGVEAGNGESGVGSRESGVEAGNGESGVGSRESGVEAGNGESGVGSRESGVRRGEAGEAGEAKEAGEAELKTSSLIPHPSSHRKAEASYIPHPSSLIPLPRPSPRATVQQLEQMLRKYL